MLVREIIKKMQRRKRVRRRRKTQDARCRRNPNAYLFLFTSLFHISSGFIYGLHYTHTLTLLQSLTLILLLPLSPIGLFFFFFQNLHPHHDLPRKDGRSSEYLEQERRYYKSYSSSSLLYHFFFFFCDWFFT